MKSYPTIVRVIVAVSVCCCYAAGVTSSSEPPSADASIESALDRSGDVGGGGGNEVLRRRTVNTYRHVNDGTSPSADAADGWIIGGSRRRASATAAGGSPSKHYYQDKTAGGDRLDKLQWPAVVAGSSDAASSLSEVQIVALPQPYQQQPQPNRDEHGNILLQQTTSEISPDASSPPSQWYSKRLSYATKSPPATSPSLQPVAAESNAVLLAEVLGQKSGFINATANKGYYGPPVTGSKGFQNDLMDMLGKSMWPARFRGTFYYT